MNEPEAGQRHRSLNRFWRWVLISYSIAALALSVNWVFSLRLFGYAPPANAYYYQMIALYLPLIFLMCPAVKTAPMKKVPWYDCFLFLLCAATALFFSFNAYTIQWEGWELNPPVKAIIFSVILWAFVLEAVRRAEGWVLLGICGLFSLYPLIAGNMPGILGGFSFSFFNAVAFHAMSTESIIGIPLRTVGDLIIGFMLFGVVLQYAGGGKFFLNLSMSLLGQARGGPAKISVMTSCLFGTMSGSAISNIITTGSFTIPTMKRIGYPPEYAAGIEAVAATGGVLMPPVMGAVAFIMASFLAVPYAQIVLAAIVPAVLYYVGLFVQVDAYAAKVGLKGIPRAQLPSFRTTMKEGWFYVFALFVLIYLLLFMRLESRAPFYTSALLLVIAMMRKDTRLTWKGLMELIASFGKLMAELTAILTGVGMVIGALSMTGIAPAFSSELIMLAGGNIALLVAMGALASFVLGTGMTITACYIFLAILLGPALVKSGIDPIAAHLFIMYWGLVSFLTPPVAMSAITAATIARCSATKAGFMSMRLGSTIFFLPFFFVFNPALILHGPIWEIVVSVVTAFAGVVAIGYGLECYVPKIGSIRPILAPIVIAGGILLAIPSLYYTLAGLIVLVSFITYFYFVRRRSVSKPANAA